MEPKVSSASVYGFVSWLVSYVALIGFTLWLLVSDRILDLVGLTYHPWKYWGVVFGLATPVLAPLYPYAVMLLSLRDNAPLESICYIGADEGRELVEPTKPQESALAWTGDLRCEIVRKIIKWQVFDLYIQPLKTEARKAASSDG